MLLLHDGQLCAWWELAPPPICLAPDYKQGQPLNISLYLLYLMTDETKFPETYHLQCYDYTDSFERLSTYEVKNWITYMMKDSPINMSISRYPSLDKTPNELMDIIISWRTWYSKWFSQFEED